ncbi:unnamed protein product [Cuscuta campestris]|uniref:Uncharacterized protein n=1 Tax=Cuscuta campestris TaxID=132261 RepID=A0A484KAN9_9ASTE|nr:unnamed protein product [Cuscuta campestris]
MHLDQKRRRKIVGKEMCMLRGWEKSRCGQTHSADVEEGRRLTCAGVVPDWVREETQGMRYCQRCILTEYLPTK